MTKFLLTWPSGFNDGDAGHVQVLLRHVMIFPFYCEDVYDFNAKSFHSHDFAVISDNDAEIHLHFIISSVKYST